MYKKDQDNFIELFSKLTGVAKTKLNKYLKDNSINSIFEHPSSLTTIPKQLDKINAINKMNNLYDNLSKHKEIYKITSPESAVDYFQNYFKNHLDREYLAAAFLDTKNQIIETKIIFTGTINASIASPRDIIKEALLLDSKSIILSHNHPSGDPQPSKEDINITERIVDAGIAIDINLLDHIIIGRNGHHSLRESHDFLFNIGQSKGVSLSERINIAKERSSELNKNIQTKDNIELER